MKKILFLMLLALCLNSCGYQISDSNTLIVIKKELLHNKRNVYVYYLDYKGDNINPSGITYKSNRELDVGDTIYFSKTKD